MRQPRKTRLAEIEAALKTGTMPRINLALLREDVERLHQFMVDHEIDDAHTAMRAMMGVATTTGSRFSVVQRARLRAIDYEVRTWLFNRLLGYFNEVMAELHANQIHYEEELRRTKEELAAMERPSP